MLLLAVSLLSIIVLIVRTKDEFVRAVVSDLVFYSMIGFYVIWSMQSETAIAYEIILLAAVAGGVLPTMSMARIISKGRR
ncbi:cation:proton antiporter [Corynebacterium mustelae]